jgi:acetyltransferase-like isoleucine patch superfamily enzyme
MFQQAIMAPWKARNSLSSWVSWPIARVLFAYNGIPWKQGWQFFGVPIIQKHRRSAMRFGNDLKLRSGLRTNPLGPLHPVFLTTWEAGAALEIGDDFAMTGGVICVAERITIGNHVMVGANCTIMDTDFHPLDPDSRRREPMAAETAPVHIEDDVFIGMHSLVLKGVSLGAGCIIGAGSVVATDVPPYTIAAGNPARVIRTLK